VLRSLSSEVVEEEEVADDSADAATEGASTATPKRRRRRRRGAAREPGSASTPTKGAGRFKETAPTLDKNLNLRPKGVMSFKDFAAQKNPRNLNERNLVAVFYLERVAAVGKVTSNQVYTCFKEAGWRLPAYPRNALQVTASTKAWLNTSDANDITVTPAGENVVDHDLPAPPKS
jgi:hypothetical protein